MSDGKEIKNDLHLCTIHENVELTEMTEMVPQLSASDNNSSTSLNAGEYLPTIIMLKK